MAWLPSFPQGRPALWQLAQDAWLEEMLKPQHRQELVELAGPQFIEWGVDHPTVVRVVKARQMVRRVEAMQALRAANPKAAAAHPDASFLEVWESLPPDRHELHHQLAGQVEEKLEWWKNMMMSMELPTLSQEDAFAASDRMRELRKRSGQEPLPHAGAWRRVLQAAVAPAAAAMPGGARCQEAAERLEAATEALPAAQKALAQELSTKLRDRALPELAPALDATLAAQAHPDPDRRTGLEQEASAAAAGLSAVNGKYGAALDALWAQLSGPMGAPPGRPPRA